MRSLSEITNSLCVGSNEKKQQQNYKKDHVSPKMDFHRKKSESK